MKYIIFNSLTILLCFSMKNVILAQNNIHNKNEIQLTDNEINYIYNRALDMAIRDKSYSTFLPSVFMNENCALYDTILISVDPILSKKGFCTGNIAALDTLQFDATLNVQLQFDKAHLYYPADIQFIHYDAIPTLEGKHMLHVRFSDIFYKSEFMYVSVMLSYQFITDPPLFNWDHCIVFKFEHCKNKFILFRNAYYPDFIMGSDFHKYIYVVKDIDDKDCY